MFLYLIIGVFGFYFGDMLFIGISFIVLMVLIFVVVWKFIIKMMVD